MSYRGWAIYPQTSDLTGIASASYQFTRKLPIDGSWLDSGTIPSNKTGIPFGFINGILDGIWVGASAPAEFDLQVYTHTGDEQNLQLLTTVTVNIMGTDYTQTFDEGDFGVVQIDPNVQFATRTTNIVTQPQDLKVFLSPTGDRA